MPDTNATIELSARALELLQSIALQSTMVARRGTVPADQWPEGATPEDVATELARIDSRVDDMLGGE